jgi:hypothetical protein
VANQEAVLNIIVAAAAAAVGQLHAVVQAIAPTQQTAEDLEQVQLVVANAVMVMQAVQSE